MTRDLDELHALPREAVLDHDHDIHVRAGRQRLEHRQRELLPRVGQAVVAVVVDGVRPRRFGVSARSRRSGAGRGGQAATAGQGEPYENESAHRDEDNKTFQLVLLDVPFDEARPAHVSGPGCQEGRCDAACRAYSAARTLSSSAARQTLLAGPLRPTCARPGTRRRTIMYGHTRMRARDAAPGSAGRGRPWPAEPREGSTTYASTGRWHRRRGRVDGDPG